jgi:hypothetical protein
MKMVLRRAVLGTGLAFAAGLTVAAALSFAQEPSSRPDPGDPRPAGNSSVTSRPASDLSSAGGGGPIASLRDALMAACAQDDTRFAHFLTARNADTFASLTPLARVALMKRFVLLDEPGKASVGPAPSGRPIMRCETPDGAAELQLGGAEAADNLAFLPVDIRDATDSVGSNVMHVKMGMVRENGDWKLLSVGLVLLDLPSLAAEWDAAQIGETEKAAIEDLRKVGSAIETYRRTYSRLPDSLAKLGPSTHGAVTPDQAGLLESDLAAGLKDGYVFRYVIVGASTLGAPAKYQLAATPQWYGRTGQRSFFRDDTGGLHGADRHGAVGSDVDPEIN